MEQDQEPRHACKLCNKSFLCGRSLGGHMRSHVLNSAETHHHLKPNKNKLSSPPYGRSNAFTDTIYCFRENLKKDCKFVDSSQDTLFLDKLCKECGKGFQSWKALFGHMKCHSERVSTTTVEDDNSWTSQSNDETLVANRRKRSSRRIQRYRATDATSTSFSVSANASTSVLSETEQEQEEVAMCLMMLSRDVGHWGGGGLNSVDESSDNYSGFLGSNLVVAKIDAKNLMGNDGGIVKFKKLRNGKLESTSLDYENLKSKDTKSEFGASKIPRNGYRMKKSDDFLGKEKKFRKVNEEFELEENLGKKSEVCEADELGSKKSNSSKRKGHDLFDPKMGMGYPTKLGYGSLDSQEKKNKFECGTCNKIFHSYQALGGHRASHKKQKTCSASTKINVSENSNDAHQFSRYPNNPIDHEIDTGNDEKADTTSNDLKKNKGSHECPICFRVFTSGQALGGHKRSHLIVVHKAEPIQEEMREFLDLNMPAPGEEESSNSHGGFKPWWIESNQKHEPPIALLSS